MEQFKKFEFFIDDLTDDAKDKFIEFLGGDDGNHDVIPFCIYESLCEDEACEDAHKNRAENVDKKTDKKPVP